MPKGDATGWPQRTERSYGIERQGHKAKPLRTVAGQRGGQPKLPVGLRRNEVRGP
jgi:hypothetical protein